MSSKPNTFTKHEKYREKYGQNEVFWGLGIEEETYLEFVKPTNVATSVMRGNHKRERYSVDYYDTSFKKGYNTFFDQMFTDEIGFVEVPFFVNAHALQKTDVEGQAKMTYEQIPKVNPKFKGQTWLEELQATAPVIFKDELGKNFVFDGDSIEFMTLDFYKAKSRKVVDELVAYK